MPTSRFERLTSSCSFIVDVHKNIQVTRSTTELSRPGLSITLYLILTFLAFHFEDAGPHR